MSIELAFWLLAGASMLAGASVVWCEEIEAERESQPRRVWPDELQPRLHNGVKAENTPQHSEFTEQ